MKNYYKSSMSMRLISLLLLFTLFLHASVTVNDDKDINLLSDTELYLDSTGKMKVDELISKPEIFKTIDKSFLNFGYILTQAVWVKFTLKNDTNETLQRTVFMDNNIIDTYNLFLLKEEKAIHLGTKGILHTKSFDGLMMFSFPISLAPKSESTYYFRASSASSATWFKLKLTTAKEAVKKDVTKQVIYALFFGGMFTLIIYNLFLLIFTKDKIYFFYSLYLLSLVLNHQTQTGMVLYWLPLDDKKFVEAEAFFAVNYLTFVIFSMILFTREFLKTWQYPHIDRLL